MILGTTEDGTAAGMVVGTAAGITVIGITTTIGVMADGPVAEAGTVAAVITVTGATDAIRITPIVPEVPGGRLMHADNDPEAKAQPAAMFQPEAVWIAMLPAVR